VQIDLHIAKHSGEHTFYVETGDTIHFIDTSGHSIYELISGDTFGTNASCNVSTANLVGGSAAADLSNSFHTVVAEDEGKTAYFACPLGQGYHCGLGMYAIVIYTAPTPAPTPAPVASSDVGLFAGIGAGVLGLGAALFFYTRKGKGITLEHGAAAPDDMFVPPKRALLL